MSRMYTEEEATGLVQTALHYNAQQQIYNAYVKDGDVHYTVCKPNLHWLRDNVTREEFKVVAADDAVICGLSESGKSVLIYSHNLPAYTVFVKQTEISTPADMEFDIPPIGSVFTHKSGRPYLIYGYGNMNANAQNREKYPVNIHYIGANGYTWDKPLETFNDSMTVGGLFRFNEGVEFEYMGICNNETLVDGFLTKEIKALFASAGRS